MFRFGTLFFSTITQSGLAVITALLQEAREQQIIADLDFDAVTHMLLGGLVTYVLTSFVLAGTALLHAVARIGARTLLRVLPLS